MDAILFWILAAVAVVAIFTAVASVLRTTDTGVVFRLADQVAMVLLGVLLAAGILLLARPRVRADAEGVEVRNTVEAHLNQVRTGGGVARGDQLGHRAAGNGLDQKWNAVHPQARPTGARPKNKKASSPKWLKRLGVAGLPGVVY